MKKANVENVNKSGNSTNTVLYEGCEFTYSTERIARNCWVAKCLINHKGIMFHVTQKGVTEYDAVQKMKSFLK